MAEINSVQKWINSVDPSSLSNLDELTTLSHRFDLKISFSQQQISGTVEYRFLAKKPLKYVELDAKYLHIKKVS
jgi:aminopeptidase N